MRGAINSLVSLIRLREILSNVVDGIFSGIPHLSISPLGVGVLVVGGSPLLENI
jgi:hypothetical protein